MQTIPATSRGSFEAALQMAVVNERPAFYPIFTYGVFYSRNVDGYIRHARRFQLERGQSETMPILILGSVPL